MTCFSETKNLQDYHRCLSLLCYTFVLLFLAFLKTVGWPLNLLTVQLELILGGASMISEDRSYQTKYPTKIFPSPLALMLHIHFSFNFQESCYNPFWIATALKSETFTAPETAAKTALETIYFMLFLKILIK